jgi:hypothetical protein
MAVDVNHKVKLLKNMLAKLKSRLLNKESKNKDGYQKHYLSKR